MKPRDGMTPDQQALEFVNGWRMLRQFLCRHLKRKSLTFLAVFEAHESGWPHLHILLRGGYIDHRLIRRWWQSKFASHQIDIRLCKNPRQRASYITKYVSKAPKGFEHCKRYWCSQDWDPPTKEQPDKPGDDFAWWEAITMHPLALARAAFYNGADITVEGDKWVIRRWEGPSRAAFGIG